MSLFKRFLTKFNHEESAISQEVKDALLHVEDEITAAEARVRQEIGEVRALFMPVEATPDTAA